MSFAQKPHFNHPLKMNLDVTCEPPRARGPGAPSTRRGDLANPAVVDGRLRHTQVCTDSENHRRPGEMTSPAVERAPLLQPYLKYAGLPLTQKRFAHCPQLFCHYNGNNYGLRGATKSENCVFRNEREPQPKLD